MVIAGGDFSLADHSLEPNVRMAVSQFGGTVAGLSSENLTRADVDLKAAVDGVGPVAITGKLDPFGATRFVDLKVDFKNVDLLPLSPYSGKFAGYELARGKLGLDIKARLEGMGLDIIGGSAESFQKRIADDVAKWSQVARDAGIKPQ